MRSAAFNCGPQLSTGPWLGKKKKKRKRKNDLNTYYYINTYDGVLAQTHTHTHATDEHTAVQTQSAFMDDQYCQRRWQNYMTVLSWMISTASAGGRIT